MNNYSNNRRFLTFISAILVLVGLISFGDKASALSLTPVRFELSGNPGEVITDKITLTNETEYTETFYASFSNFEAQGETGNPSFVDPKDGLGTWMKIQDFVTLAPGKSNELEFSINIPKDAEPGGHFAVIFFGNSPKEKDNAVSIGSQTGTLVLLSVKGDVKQGGGVTQFNTKGNKFFYNSLPVDFEYKLQNQGNDRIKPAGYLKIRNTLFIPTKKLDGNPVEGNILPNSTRKFDLTWVNHARETDYVEPANPILNFLDDVKYQFRNFALGFYSARLNLSFNELKFDGGRTVYFFVFPWQLVITLIVILLVLYLGGGKLLKHYNQYIIKKARISQSNSI